MKFSADIIAVIVLAVIFLSSSFGIIATFLALILNIAYWANIRSRLNTFSVRKMQVGFLLRIFALFIFLAVTIHINQNLFRNVAESFISIYLLTILILIMRR